MEREVKVVKDLQYFKFCCYGFLKNLRFFEPFIILFYLEKGLTYTQIGILFAIREVARNIFEIPSGVLADIFGRRRTMILSFSSYIISFLIYYFSKSFVAFIPAVIVYGFGDAFRTGTHKAMIFEYLKIKKRAHLKPHYYGHTRSWSQKGSALSAVLAAIFVFYKGDYTTIFLFSIIPYFLDLLLILTYPKILDGGFSQSAGKGAVKQSFLDTYKSLKASFKDTDALRCVANISIFSGYHMAVKDYIQPVIKSLAVTLPFLLVFEEKQQTALFMGAVYFIIYMLTSASSKKAGLLADRKGRRSMNSTLLGGLLVGLLSGLFFWLRLEVASIVFFVGIYIVQNLRKPVGVSYISERFEERVLASALSIQSQAETLFAAVFAVIIGFSADILGLGFALVLVSVIGFLLYPLLRIRLK